MFVAGTGPAVNAAAAMLEGVRGIKSRLGSGTSKPLSQRTAAAMIA